jgi:hypothetical protein
VAPNSECGEQTWADRTTSAVSVTEGGREGALWAAAAVAPRAAAMTDTSSSSPCPGHSILVQLSPQRQTRVLKGGVYELPLPSHRLQPGHGHIEPL